MPKGKKRKATLRADTTLAPAGKPRAEVYVGELPACCLTSFKEAVVEGGEKRMLGLECSRCGREWVVVSSLDERVLGRFVAQAGPRVVKGGTHPAA